MSERLDRLLLESAKRRQAANPLKLMGKAQLVLDLLMPMQKAVVLDPSKRIAARTPRRGGKTTTVRGRLMHCCLSKRNANCLYVALTRQSAESLMWGGKTGLKRFVHELGLEHDVEFNNSKLQMVIRSTGSVLTLTGADNRADIDKHRGGEFDEAWIDEAKSFPERLLKELIAEVIEPALLTRDGALGMIGTPGNLLSGPFYDVTRTGSEIARPYGTPLTDDSDKRVWSFHTWTMADNTAAPEQWARALKVKADNGYSDTNPIWLREFLGQWAANDTDHVYRFRAHDGNGKPWNIWTPGPKTKQNPFGLPLEHQWQFVYGLDMGHGDPFAFEVWAFSETSRDILQCWEFTRTKMSVTEVGQLLEQMTAKTGYPMGIVSDTAGLGGMVLQEIAERFGIKVEAAEKKNKVDAIELTNADLIDGHMKLLDEPGIVNTLRQQMLELQWDETGLKENKAQRNDCCDATIYARRKALHHYGREPLAPDPKPGTPEAIGRMASEEERRAAEQSVREGEDYLADLAANDVHFASFFGGGDGGMP